MITALEAKHIHSSSSGVVVASGPEVGREAVAVASSRHTVLLAASAASAASTQAQRKWWSQLPPGSDLKSRRVQR